jgi:hypothetical protein
VGVVVAVLVPVLGVLAAGDVPEAVVVPPPPQAPNKADTSNAPAQ